MFIYEASFRSHIQFSEFATLLSDVLSIPIDQIGSEDEFWERLDSGVPLALGLSIQWCDAGYKTFAKWFQQREISDSEFLAIAEKAARSFGTEVAIGNFIDATEVSTDRFLVITPDGQCYRAFAVNNSDVFDVKAEGAVEPLSGVLKRMR